MDCEVVTHLHLTCFQKGLTELKVCIGVTGLYYVWVSIE